MLRALRLLVRAIRAQYRRSLIACACLLAVLSLAHDAHADSSVLLVVKGAPDQDTAPYELRLRSEFAAEGLEVVTASGRSQQNLLDLEGLARRTGAVAALSVYIDAQEVQGRLWVSDPNSSADLVRTLHVLRAEGDSVSVFALRAVEALRGARLELEQQRKRMITASGTSGESGEAAAAPASGGATSVPGAQTANPVSAPSRPNTKPEPNKPKPEPKTSDAKKIPLQGRRREMHWTVLVGASGGFDLNGLGLIAAPFLDLRYRVWQRLSLGASLEGPFLKRKGNYAGVVQVDQELLELQARLCLVNSRRLTVEGLMSTGPSRYAVAGTQPSIPGTGEDAQSVGWLFGAGAGAQLALTGHWIMALDLEWLRRFPSPVIYAGKNRLTGETDSLVLGKIGMGVVF